MDAAKSQNKETNCSQHPRLDRYLAVILKEITGKRVEKDAVAKLRLFIEDGALLACGWNCRRGKIVKTVELWLWDVESVGKLAKLLNLSEEDGSALTEHLEEIRKETDDALRSVAILDRLLAGKMSKINLHQHPKLASLLLRGWLSLEIRFRPGDSGPLTGLRDRLMCEAERQEIDPRGLGI